MGAALYRGLGVEAEWRQRGRWRCKRRPPIHGEPLSMVALLPTHESRGSCEQAVCACDPNKTNREPDGFALTNPLSL